MRGSIVGLLGAALISLTGCSEIAANVTNVADTEFTCGDLAEDAVRVSKDQDAMFQLLKVREAEVVTDNRDTYTLPKGTGEALILKCKGMGVWSDGSNSPVVVMVTVDADGDMWTGYRGK